MLDRRRFLQFSGLGIIGFVADSACSTTARDSDALDHSQLLAMLGADRVRQLGAHYRAATPSENTADRLRAAVSNGHPFRIPLLGIGSIDDQIRADFTAGRTVLVDGWVLSVTEARQAALFSLAPA